MPAAPRLLARQAAFAVRTVSSEVPSTRKVASRGTPFPSRLRAAAAELGVSLSGVRSQEPGLRKSRRREECFSPGLSRYPTPMVVPRPGQRN